MKNCGKCKHYINDHCNNIDFCENYSNFKETENKKEMVMHPSHYNSGQFEVIEVIEDWKLNFNLGNAVKYIGRCEHKKNKVEDLKKAIFYIEREIENTK